METTEPQGNAKISKIITLITAGFSLLLLILLTNMFFQQDEWHSFGLILGYGSRYLTLDKPLLTTLLFDRIGARVVTYGFFSLFGTQAIGFGILAWLLHVTNSFFVYLLTFKLLKNKLASLVASFFFLVNAVGHQGYSWFGTMAGTATSTTLLLASLVFFVEYLQKNRKKYLSLSLLSLSLSFLFKETAFFLFLLYPLLWLLWQKHKATVGQFLTNNVATLLLGLFTGVLFVRTLITIPGDRANYVSATPSGLTTLVSHAVRYPIEGSVQVFLPAPVTFTLAQGVTRLFRQDLPPDTSEYDAFYQTTTAEVVSIVFAAALILFLLRLYIKRLNRADSEAKKVFWLSVLFLPLSFLPYIVLSRFDAYLESRYYYAPAIGASLLLGVLTAVFLKIKNNKTAVVALALLLLAHLAVTTSDLITQVHTSRVRKNILTTIRALVPKLNEKTVFFVTGNSPGYYGLPELKVPFQSGLGHILMVEYVGGKQLPPEFFQEETLGKALDVGFLYDIVGEGFRQKGNQGFGYYITPESLAKEIDQGTFGKNDIIPLFYDADTQTIRRTNFSSL